MTDLSAEYDRDIVCGCPYCGLLRLGKLIPEPTEPERYQAMLRCAQRNTPEDRDALERARANEDMPQDVREAIKRTTDYAQLKRISEMRAEHLRSLQQAQSQQAQRPPSFGFEAQSPLSEALQKALERQLPGAKVRVLGGGGQGGLPEFKDFVARMVGIDPGGAVNAPEANAAALPVAIDRLEQLLAADDEMDSTDREIAILRVREVRALWEAR